MFGTFSLNFKHKSLYNVEDIYYRINYENWYQPLTSIPEDRIFLLFFAGWIFLLRHSQMAELDAGVQATCDNRLVGVGQRMERGFPLDVGAE